MNCAVDSTHISTGRKAAPRRVTLQEGQQLPAQLQEDRPRDREPADEPVVLPVAGHASLLTAQFTVSCNTAAVVVDDDILCSTLRVRSDPFIQSQTRVLIVYRCVSGVRVTLDELLFPSITSEWHQRQD